MMADRPTKGFPNEIKDEVQMDQAPDEIKAFLAEIECSNDVALGNLKKGGYHTFERMKECPPTSVQLEGFGWNAYEANRIRRELKTKNRARASAQATKQRWEHLFARSLLNVQACSGAPYGFQRAQMSDLIYHVKEIGQLVGKSPGTQEIITISGVRRCGKTVLCYQLISHLLDSGVSEDKIIFLDLDHLSSTVLPQDSLGEFLEECLRSGYEYVFLDEIKTDKPLSCIKSIQDQARCNKRFQMILTGSRADVFQDANVATILYGRTRDFPLSPLSFQEFVKATECQELEEYLFWGGFPQVVDRLRRNEKKAAKAAVDDIMTQIIVKDIKFDGAAHTAIADSIQQLFQKDLIKKDRNTKGLIQSLLDARVLVPWTDFACTVVDVCLLNAYLQLSYDYTGLHPQTLATVWVVHLACQKKKVRGVPPFIAVNQLQRYAILPYKDSSKSLFPHVIDFLMELCQSLKNGQQIEKSVLGIIGYHNIKELLLQDSSRVPQLPKFQNVSFLLIPASYSLQPIMKQFASWSLFSRVYSRPFFESYCCKSMPSAIQFSLIYLKQGHVPEVLEVILWWYFCLWTKELRIQR